jgi:SAM-dependent methyltransferase
VILQKVKGFIQRILPLSISLNQSHQKQQPDEIPWDYLRRLTPVSSNFGFDRGQPIDRYYIESFLEKYRNDIHGDVMEIGDPSYTKKFGGDRVNCSHVLHVEPGNPLATLIGDLASGKGIPEAAFDCIILPQTLLVIFDFQAAIVNIFRSLKPGGILLATFPGISRISRYDMDRWGDYWRFTDASAGRLFGNVFGKENVVIETYGNVYVACAFLYGLAAHELKKDEMAYHDPDYQVLISVRALKGN